MVLSTLFKVSLQNSITFDIMIKKGTLKCIFEGKVDALYEPDQLQVHFC